MNPTIVFNISSKNGKGQGSFLLALFNFIKSIQIINFPFFLGTTTIGDNHIASSIGWMNHVATNLLISCLTANEFNVDDLDINEFIINNLTINEFY
jgi:hypothetical protein